MIMKLFRKLIWILVIDNFIILCDYVLGKINIIVDFLF